MRYAALLEWAFAAKWWGYTWEAFGDLDGDDQAFLVAVYRVHQQTEAVTAWWQTRKKPKRRS